MHRLSRSIAKALVLGTVGTCLLFTAGLRAQTAPGTQEKDDELRLVIVLARHGIRTPIESETRGSRFNAQPWPAWPVAPGLVTPHGGAALRLLGEYYRERYPGLLDAPTCAERGVYVEANTVPRTIASAKALLTGMSPDCPVEVHVRAGRNPLFGPPATAAANHTQLDDAILGRMGGQPEWYSTAYARQLGKMHQILTDCSSPACQASTPDFRSPAQREANATRYETPVTLAADFAENLLLQYTEGLPMQQVGWGRVSRSDLDDVMELNTRYHDFMLRTPLYAEVAASNLAAHLRDTLAATAHGKPQPLQLGTSADHFVLLDGHDANLTWLGGLLRIDWLLPDQTLNATPPGSSLIFELHRSRSTGAQTVRVLFVSQTLDQMRALTPLTGKQAPSVAPVYVPGCSGPAPDFACTADAFTEVLTRSIRESFVETPADRQHIP